MILENIIEQKLKEKCEDNLDDYIQMVSEWFAYIVLSKKRKRIDHSIDPPWDNSGRVISTDEKLQLEDYATFEEFLENELTGESFATYVSNMGIAHYTYDRDFELKSMDWIYHQVKLVIEDLIKVKNVYLVNYLQDKDMSCDIDKANMIEEEMNFEDIAVDCRYYIFFELREKISKADPHFLFKRGKDNAKKRIKEERKRANKRKKIFEENRKQAKNTWQKISKKYKMKYGEEMPRKVEKPLYDKKLKQLLNEMYEHGVNVEEIQNVGEYLSYKFSNSVCNLLLKFKYN
mgnify:FL=1